MKTTMAVVALAALVSFSAPTVHGFAADADLSAKVAAAKTATDHEALADAFEAQAKDAEARAAAHDKMAASYKGLGKVAVQHETHCGNIARRERDTAKDLNALAEAHRAQAKAAK